MMQMQTWWMFSLICVLLQTPVFGDDWLSQLSSCPSGSGPQFHQECRHDDLRPYSHGEQMSFGLFLFFATDELAVKLLFKSQFLARFIQFFTKPFKPHSTD